MITQLRLHGSQWTSHALQVVVVAQGMKRMYEPFVLTQIWTTTGPCAHGVAWQAA